MAVTKLNLSIDSGTDYFLSATYDDYLTGLPRDLTGYSAVLTVRPAFNDPNILLTLSTTLNTILIGGIGGSIVVHFTPAMTDPMQQTIPWDRGVYDMIITDPNGIVTKLLSGYIILTGTVGLTS